MYVRDKGRRKSYDEVKKRGPTLFVGPRERHLLSVAQMMSMAPRVKELYLPML